MGQHGMDNTRLSVTRMNSLALVVNIEIIVSSVIINKKSGILCNEKSVSLALGLHKQTFLLLKSLTVVMH